MSLCENTDDRIDLRAKDSSLNDSEYYFIKIETAAFSCETEQNDRGFLTGASKPATRLNRFLRKFSVCSSNPPSSKLKDQRVKKPEGQRSFRRDLLVTDKFITETARVHSGDLARIRADRERARTIIRLFFHATYSIS